MDYDFLLASNGSGDAALMHINATRLTGSTTIHVDTLTNVPAKFIGTYGDLLPSGFLDPATEVNFLGHTSGSTIVIDSFEPGSVDAGNTSGQVILIKPNTGWANRVAAFIENATNNGTPDDLTVDDLTAADIIAATLVIDGSVLLDGLTNATYRHTMTSGDASAGYVQLSFAHGLDYTPHVDGRFGIGTTPTTFYPLPCEFITNKNYFGIPPSATISIISVDATNINVGIGIHDISGGTFLTTTSVLKFQFYCSPFPAVAL